MHKEEDMVCAVGAEMRDYTTLLEAIRGTGIRCHMATDHVRIPGRFRLLKDRRVPIGNIGVRDERHVAEGRMWLTVLRTLYARSRFVVPLLPSDIDNGVTVILEAMSLWNQPPRAQQMGRNARAYVEKYHTLEKVTSTARSGADASLDGRPAPDTGWE